MSLDILRPPGRLDRDAAAYKDWLHLNVFDHRSGTVGIFNLSLHGGPEDPRARAIGTALLHVPNEGWTGNVEVEPLASANIGATAIGLPGVALATDAAVGQIHLSARLPRDRFRAQVVATGRSTPIRVEQRLPFGSGWISWHALPRLTVKGSVSAGGRTFDLGEATAYHDHNWGRWHWGEDVGWEWGAFVSPGDGPTLVFSRATDRDRRAPGPAMLVVDGRQGRRTFAGPSVTFEVDGDLDARPRRLPGALAALHQDRSRPRLPGRVRLRADDGIDAVEVEFRPQGAAQLIAADPAVRGYGFIHEMAGRFHARGTVAGEAIDGGGLGIFEYVD